MIFNFFYTPLDGANFPIFCRRIIVIFWTTCIARGEFYLVIIGNLTHILPVLQWLEVVIAFVSSWWFHLNRKSLWVSGIDSRVLTLNLIIFSIAVGVRQQMCSRLPQEMLMILSLRHVQIAPKLRLVITGTICPKGSSAGIVLLTGRFSGFSHRRGDTLHR